MGTHGELMAEEGKYRELFQVQSKYYNQAAGMADAGEGEAV